MSSTPQIVIVGGGLAGLAAAAQLAVRNVQVTLLESRPRLGGRASSITDRTTGETIDNCQHVTMGCCYCFRHFTEQLGFADRFAEQSQLFFVGPPSSRLLPNDEEPVPLDRSPVVAFSECFLPTPAHLSLALFKMPWFSLREKLQIAFAMRALARATTTTDEAFSTWLGRHRQSETVQRRFWHLVLVSALSESLDRISLKHARKVFVDGFLKHRSAWRVSIPDSPLDDIYETCVRQWMTDNGVNLQTKAGGSRIEFSGNVVTGVRLRSGEVVSGDEFIVAVPHYLVAGMLPEQLQNHSTLAALSKLETAPIASVHLWYDRPVTNLPHAVLVDRLSQWMFNRSSGQSHYLQVVISAARDLSALSESDVVEIVARELQSVWPDSGATLLHGRLITEHRAVFAPLPGVDDVRPAQQSPIPNLQFAGDWTRTGWPSTMEGAVRSGYLAAENVLARLGRPSSLIPAEPASAFLYHALFE